MPKFLLDENVRRELGTFLKAKNLDVKIVPKTTADETIALISKKEKRVVITNDEDFSKRYGREKIFSVVWLKIAQNDPTTLIRSLNKLREDFGNFEGKLITLYPTRWETSPLIRE